ncbi:MAG: apolipoprotein N-acyltransferase [Verrucomicrobia bacterium]|nr:apolipoprotein N-acyltransferase [Verrucomicrobiota bacterium]
MKSLLYSWLLPAVSGLLLALAYPPFNRAECAWIALVPLLFALERSDRWPAFRRGWLAGLVFFGMTVWWTIHVTVAGTVGLIAALAMYFGVAAMIFSLAASRLAARDSALRNLLLAVVGTAWWVTLEWVRGKIIFGGFGWNGLGVSQHQTLPIIQIASVTGVYGVSALVCFVNFAIFFTIRRFVHLRSNDEPARRLSWELYAAVALVCVTFVNGLKLLRGDDDAVPGLRVALIQGNIPQQVKFDPTEKPMIEERYRALTEKAALLKPDLVIWPETATPGALRYDLESYRLVSNLVALANAPLLTGTMDVVGSDWFNAAALVHPDGKIAGLYHKIHLVAFGEYVPLRKILPVMKWLTPIDGSFERGNTVSLLALGATRFGAVICFEDTLPDLYRQFVRRGADFMVNLTNDAWFKESPAAEMHLANAVFRAVETRRPLVRCTNNGVTCVVDEFGYIKPERRLPAHQEGLLVCTVPLVSSNAHTFYVQHGDWFVAACALISSLACGWMVWRLRQRESQP